MLGDQSPNVMWNWSISTLCALHMWDIFNENSVKRWSSYHRIIKKNVHKLPMTSQLTRFQKERSWWWSFWMIFWRWGVLRTIVSSQNKKSTLKLFFISLNKLLYTEVYKTHHSHQNFGHLLAYYDNFIPYLEYEEDVSQGGNPF